MATENLVFGYSDLASLMVYQFLVDDDEEPVSPKKVNRLSAREITRIINLAWESPAPFDVVAYLYGLSTGSLKKLMKSKLKFRCYTVWRKQAENTDFQAVNVRLVGMARFKNKLRQMLASNSITKRK